MSAGGGWQFHGLTVRHRTDGPLTFFKSRGVVSAEALAYGLDRCSESVPAQPSGALVSCLLDADMRVGFDDLCTASLRAGRHTSVMAMPTALVVPAAAVGYWRAYAATMAGAGIVRGVFAAADAATRWATCQAAVARAEAAFRRPTQATGR